MIEHHVDLVASHPGNLAGAGIVNLIDGDVDGQVTGRFYREFFLGRFHSLELIAARHQQGQAT